MSQVRGFLLVLTTLLLVASPAPAQEQQYELSNFDVTVRVQPDGTYEVEEAIAYNFQQGTFSQAYRSIVQEDAGAVRDIRVTSPDTAVDSVRVTEEDDVRRIQWRYPPRAEPARFEIRYGLDGAIFERGDRNVVSLDVMADEAVVPTLEVDVRVLLPSGFNLEPGQISVDPGDGAVQREAGRVVAQFHRDLLEEGDDWSVEVSFPKRVQGAFLPTAGDLVVAFFLVFLGIGAGSYLNWSWRGPRPEVTARRPPSDLDLPTAAVLLRNRSGQAVPAVLFDLVRRGHVTLQHDQEGAAFGEKQEVVRLDVHADRADLSDIETRLVETLRTYDTLDEFWSDTSSFRKEIVEERRAALAERGWMERHAVRSNALVTAAVIFLLGGLVAVFTAEGTLTFYLLFGGMGLSAGSLIAGLRRRGWTEAGARKAMALRSFLDHEKAEIDRLRETDPVRAAERLVDSLPWLVLHDEVSKSWIEKTKDALERTDAVPEVPDGFVSLVTETETPASATAAFLPVVGVMAAMESSGAGAAGAAGAAAAGGAAGGAAGAAGAA